MWTVHARDWVGMPCCCDGDICNGSLSTSHELDWSIGWFVEFVVGDVGTN